VLGELREVSQRRYVSPVRVAEIHVGLKETNQAFAWLQKADQGRAFHLIFLLVDPIWDPLRSDPRWKTLLQRMYFPDVPSGR
jgi:hypothetical protein